MLETLKRLFSPVEGMNADEAKRFIAAHKEGEYTLLDVRQPKENQRARIPGSTLIPLPRLADELGGLDKEKPVIVYCAIGGRSRVAAQMLAGYGFKKVYNLNGGIDAWNGLTAEGPVELSMDLIRGDETPVEIVELAYGMEMSLGHFYRTVKNATPDRGLADLVEKLASVEDRHRDFLADILRTLGVSDDSIADMSAQMSAGIMEGGFRGEDLIEKNRDLLLSVAAMLDLSMMLEAQALDLYLRFASGMENEQTRDLLYRIADEEKKHLSALGQLREERA